VGLKERESQRGLYCSLGFEITEHQSLWLLFGRRGAVGALWILGFYGHKRAASIKGLLMAFTKGVGYCAREGCSQMSAVVARRVILGACGLLLRQVMASTAANQPMPCISNMQHTWCCIRISRYNPDAYGRECRVSTGRPRQVHGKLSPINPSDDPWLIDMMSSYKR